MGILNRLFGTEKRAEVVTADDHLLSLLKNIEITPETAMEIPAVSACIGFISSIVAALPVKLYQENKDKNITEEVKDDLRLRLLNDETGDLLDPFQMKKAVIEDYFLYGGGYIYPEMYGNEFVSLRYIRYGAISSFLYGKDPVFKVGEYVLSNGMSLRDDEVIKLLRDTKDGLKGESIITAHQQILSTMYREIVYEKLLISSGGNKKGFLTSESKLSPEMMADLRQKWQEMYANTGNTMMILNKGITFHESSNTSVEMQLNENKARNNELICQIFNLSADAVSGRLDGDALTAVIKAAVVPVITAFEAALNKGMLLPSERDLMYYTFDTTELLKGDILKRYQAYKTGLECNVLQIDEARYKEDLPPLGLNWIKLGLQDVLYDPKTKTIYTPNMNQSMTMNESKVNFGKNEVDNPDEGGIIEERSDREVNYKQNPSTGRMEGSYPSGGSSGSSGGGSGEREEAPRRSDGGKYSVDWEKVQSKEYDVKISKISDDEKVCKSIKTRAKWALNNRDGKDTEELYAIDLATGKEIGQITNQNISRGVKRTSSFEKRLAKADSEGTKILLIHNHPTGMPPSPADINELLKLRNAVGITVGHDGSIYKYTKPTRMIDLRDWDVSMRHYNNFSEKTAQEKTMLLLSQKYGFTVEEL